MATFDEALQTMTNIQTRVGELDAKLDEVRAFINTLKANQPVTQAQLDQLKGLMDQTEAQLNAVFRPRCY